MLVIGDLILDHYVWGRVSRISPEAPVPVVHVESESSGSAARRMSSTISWRWEGKADLCGVIGSDESGRLLLKELGNNTIEPWGGRDRSGSSDDQKKSA